MGCRAVGLWVCGLLLPVAPLLCACSVALGCCSRRFRCSVVHAVSPLPPVVASGCCQSVVPGCSVAPRVVGLWVAAPACSLDPAGAPLLSVVAPCCPFDPLLLWFPRCSRLWLRVIPLLPAVPLYLWVLRSSRFLLLHRSCVLVPRRPRLMVPVVSSVALRQTKKQKKTSDEKTEKKQKQRKNNRKKGYGPKFHFSIESVHNEMAKAFLRQTPDFSEFSSPSRPDFLGGAGGEKDGKNKAAESAERKIGGHLAKKKKRIYRANRQKTISRDATTLVIATKIPPRASARFGRGQSFNKNWALRKKTGPYEKRNAVVMLFTRTKKKTSPKPRNFFGE